MTFVIDCDWVGFFYGWGSSSPSPYQLQIYQLQIKYEANCGLFVFFDMIKI